MKGISYTEYVQGQLSHKIWLIFKLYHTDHLIWHISFGPYNMWNMGHIIWSMTYSFLSDSASSLTERLFDLRLTFRVGNSKSFWRSFKKRFKVDVLPHEIRFCFFICFETLVRVGGLCVRQWSSVRVSEVSLCLMLFGCDLFHVKLWCFFTNDRY